MASPEYHDDSRFTVQELRTVKLKIDRERKRESDADSRLALQIKSATEYLRGT